LWAGLSVCGTGSDPWLERSEPARSQCLKVQETYNYDLANNLGSKMVNSVLTSYTYDFIDQLKTESSSSLSNTYNYDNNGNRINRISNAGTDIYSYDFGDKLTGISRTYGAGSTYTYDGCGRTATISGSGGTRIFTWDYEDRLTNLSGGGVPSTNYGYNGVGSRVTKSGTGGARTYKRDGVGVTAPVLADGVATMVPGVSERTSGQTNFIHTDRLGSMKGMSNSANVTETADYDAFGKVIAHANATGTQKGFASGYGYQEDSESGYKLLGHRYYDADTGRFLSRDPAQKGKNWYQYGRNNPLKYLDPTGLVTIIGFEFSCENWEEAIDTFREAWKEGASMGFVAPRDGYEDRPGYGASKWFSRLWALASAAVLALGAAEVIIPATAGGVANAGSRAASEAASKVSNPYGCLGKPDHQKAISDWGQSALAQGRNVESGGGLAKTIMYPMTNGRVQAPDGVAVYQGLRGAFEAGRALKNGEPNMREFIKIGNLLDSGFDEVDWGGLGMHTIRLGGRKFGPARI